MKQAFKPGRRAALRTALALGTVAAALPASPAHAQRARTLERAPAGNTPEERRVLSILDEVYRNHRYLSVPEEDRRLLRVLTESIGAKHVVELGTSTGYSGLWLLLALAKTGGRLTTYEIDRGRHEMARQNFERAELNRRIASGFNSTWRSNCFSGSQAVNFIATR